MNESDVKTKLIVAPIRKAGGYARRIEDKFSVGFPDIVFKMPHYAITFCEVKLVRGRFFSPSPRQLIELKALDLDGVWSVVVGYDMGTKLWYISPPVEKVDTESCFYSPNNFPAAFKEYVSQ